MSKKGVTITYNGTNFWFEDYDALYELLNAVCDDATESDNSKNQITFDDGC